MLFFFPHKSSKISVFKLDTLTVALIIPLMLQGECITPLMFLFIPQLCTPCLENDLSGMIAVSVLLQSLKVMRDLPKATITDCAFVG